MYFQPEIETMPREELRELQLERMRESLRNAYENVPLYRERFDAAGVTPDDLESLEDIAKFPFVVKQDMRDNYPFGMFARENADVARIHASSGTTGQATVVGHTANDLANWGDCFARGIAMVGGDENSTIQVSYGYGLFTGGLGAHAGGEAMGCTVIPTSSGNTKRQVQMLKDCKTDILACTPSYALLIADTAIEMGYDPATEFQISGGIFGAEPCSENMRQEIADKLGIQYCDVYGLSEIMGPGVAMECAERGGLHIAEDQFYCEIIDPETLEVLPDGEVGELVITTLTRECSPMIRYRTRDVTTINAEPCACGRTHRKIGRLLGRTDDMLIIRGVNVFPSQIEQVITEFPEIATQYQIILTMNGPLDHVELQVETEPDFPIDEVRRLDGPAQPSGRGPQEQPAGGRRHQVRGAQDHRALRGQGQARHRPERGEPVMISQLTVFLANEKGRLAAACRTLADADINMKALFIADTADFGIVRIFCDTPARAVEVLGQAGFRASLTPVIAVSVEDAPGTLADLLGFCQGASMNIEYGYCFCTADGKAVDVLKIEGDGAEAVLAEAGFAVLAPEEVYCVDPA